MLKKFLGLVFLLMGFSMVPIAFWQSIFLPEPVTFELPSFHGRIIHGERGKPGTFTIHQDFESISGWGKDAIMTYEISAHGKLGERFVLQAWTPDPQTNG